MRRPPSSLQQLLAGLVVTVVVAATLLGGVILALSDRVRAGIDVADQPTPTTLRLSTLPPDTEQVSTATELPPRLTHTPQETASIIPNSTRVTATREPSTTPTASPTRRLTISPAATNTPCRWPEGWQSYVVQPGENLFQIGLRYGLLVDEMMQANCLKNASIAAGDVIRVPPVTPRVSATPRDASTSAAGESIAPKPTSTQTATDGACTNPDSVIASPRVGQRLSGVVQFRGTARVPDFAFYKLEIRREGASIAGDYVTFMTGEIQVSGGVLGEVNTGIYADGEYWVRLVVVNNTGNYPERCAILYLFDN